MRAAVFGRTSAVALLCVLGWPSGFAADSWVSLSLAPDGGYVSPSGVVEVAFCPAGVTAQSVSVPPCVLSAYLSGYCVPNWLAPSAPGDVCFGRITTPDPDPDPDSGDLGVLAEPGVVALLVGSVLAFGVGLIAGKQR